MGNFLAILPRMPGLDVAPLLDRGIEIARRLKGQTPASRLQTRSGGAALFARCNGSTSSIVTDPGSGSWLLAAGTWFHRDGYGSGAEGRLLSCYLAGDARMLARELDGFFCLVIGDARNGETLVLTDVVGSYHCFVRETQEAIAISGSSLLLAALRDFHLDPIGCQEFLQTGVVYEDRTCYAEVRKLGPASIFRFGNEVREPKQSYWQASALVSDSLAGEKAVDRLWDGLTHAAAQIGRLFGRVVCDLTGGYDSRAMVAGFRGARVPFATTVSGAADSGDVRISKELAQRLGVAHNHMAPGNPPTFAEVREALRWTDGEYDLVEYARIARVHRALMQRYDISINGSFGELARGYWWELLVPRLGARRPLDAALLARRRYAALPADSAVAPRGSDIDLTAHFADIVRRTNAGLEEAPNTLQMDHAYLRMRMQRWQGRIASSTNQLWPCLSPFMFRPLLEAMMQAPARLRLRSLLIRRMLAQFQPELADYPLEYGHPAAPLTWRNWHRFAPLLTHYARRAADKAARIAGRSGFPPRTPGRSTAARLELWRDPQVREVLHAPRMRLTSLVEESRLADFLGRAQQTGFAFDDQWARVLTLECALRALEEVGARPRG